jgi:drug/metabolite transporter, DME family
MSSQKASYRGFCFIICASIAWGTVGVATQLIAAHNTTNALSVAFFRLALAAPIFFLGAWFLLGRRFWQIKARHLAIMLIMGTMQALYQASYTASVNATGITISTLIAICIAPVIVALVSTLLLRERLPLRALLALICALTGTVLLVAARTHVGKDQFSLLGIWLALLAATGYAIYILCGQRLTSIYHPLHINAVAFGSGALLLFLCASATHLVTTYSISGWFLLLYLGCIPTALAYGLFQAGMRTQSATITSILTLCEPLTAALLAWLIFREELGALGLLGAALLLGAMILLVKKP